MKYLTTLKNPTIEREFGKLGTDEVVLTDERAEHIRLHHPEDYALFEHYGKRNVDDPDIVIKDLKNESTVFMVLRIKETNLNTIIRLSVAGKDPGKLKNSIMTFFRIRDKNLVKLMEKNKVLYKRDEP